MHQALAAGRIPFALLKPTKGVPVVVKVQFAAGSKHVSVFFIYLFWFSIFNQLDNIVNIVQLINDFLLDYV